MAVTASDPVNSTGLTPNPNTDHTPLAAAATEVPPALSAALRALGASAGGASAARLLALLYDPEVDVDRILHCLSGEPALAARVLKVANSPYYGRSGAVGSLERAVQLLGLVAVRGIAAAGALDRLLPVRAGQGFDPLRFRRHSTAVALAAQALSTAAHCGIEGEAYMAGLLHDIGLLLLVKADPERMARFVPPAAADERQAEAAETAHFGIDHCGAGALILAAWGMPAWLKAAVGGHHAEPSPEPGAAGAGGLQALPPLLRLADRLAGAAGYGQWPRCAGVLDETALAGLPLTLQDLQTVLENLPAAVDALSADV